MLSVTPQFRPAASEICQHLAATALECRCWETPERFSSDVSTEKADSKPQDLQASNGKTLPSLIRTAAANGHRDILSGLDLNHRSINCKDIRWLTPLHYASIEGSDTIVRLLLSAGAAVTALTPDKESAMSLACKSNVELALFLLLETQQHLVGKKWGNLVFSAYELLGEKAIFALCSANKVVKGASDRVAYWLLLATFNGRTQMVRDMLKCGVDVNVSIGDGMTALHVAAAGNDCELLEIFLDEGADINAMDMHGYTPLCSALEKPADDTIELLLKRGAATNIVFELADINTTPLHFAIKKRRFDVALKLLQFGADVHITDGDGNSPWILAATVGSISMMVMLYLYGANVRDVNRNGETGLNLALNYVIAKISIARGIDFEAIVPMVKSNAALHAAVRERRKIVLEELLGRGANCAAEPLGGETPLEMAYKMNDNSNDISPLIWMHLYEFEVAPISSKPRLKMFLEQWATVITQAKELLSQIRHMNSTILLLRDAYVERQGMQLVVEDKKIIFYGPVSSEGTMTHLVFYVQNGVLLCRTSMLKELEDYLADELESQDLERQKP